MNIRRVVLACLVFCTALSAFALPPLRGRTRALRAAANAEYVVPEIALADLGNGKYRVRGRVRVDRGETLHLAYEVDVRTHTYTTRVLERRFEDRISAEWVFCCHRYANVATYDPANIELARVTNMFRWTADSDAGTVTPFRGSGTCWAHPYTSLGTTWYVTSCFMPPASGFGYTAWKTASGSMRNFDFGLDTLQTNAYLYTEIEAYGTASFATWDAVHDGEGSWLLRGVFNTGGGDIDGECGFGGRREPIDRDWTLCPIVLDLNGDGLQTSAEPVEFDLDADGDRDRMTWTNASSEEGFLWIDLDENHRVDNGAELFGTGTLLPTGARAANGFDALRVYDDPLQGGNGDGVLAPGDRMWGRLRLWVDRNHDGQSTHDEIATLAQMGVKALQLEFEEGASLDDAENDHRFRGHYLKQLSGPRSVRLMMNDIFFWPVP